MLKSISIVIAGSLLAASAFAINPINPAASNPTTLKSATAEQAVELKDGTTLYIFKDGKMGMRDLYRKARYMEPGAVMETKDGEKIAMGTYDQWQLQSFLKPVGR